MKFDRYYHHASATGFPSDLISNLETTLGQLKLTCQPKAGPAIRKAILSELQGLGWSDRIKVKGDLKLTISGVLGDSGLCVQFGNVARIYADLIKLQLAYNDSVIRRAVIVVPTKATGRIIGSNLVNFERLQNELVSLNSTVTVPLAIYGVFDE